MGRGRGSSGGGGGGAPTAGSTSGSGGLASHLNFVQPPTARAGNRATVMVDVAKLEASLAADPGYHVGAGGTGPSSVAGRYAEARRFLERAATTGQPVHMSRVHVDASGAASILDGRHRFAVLRDSGATAVPVSVTRSNAPRVRRLFGA